MRDDETRVGGGGCVCINNEGREVEEDERGIIRGRKMAELQ